MAIGDTKTFTALQSNAFLGESVRVLDLLLQMWDIIQTLLLTSVFHEKLSFMNVGHNPTCVSILTLAAVVQGGALSPPLAISVIPGFQIAFP